jgi:hypothetical protein
VGAAAGAGAAWPERQQAARLQAAARRRHARERARLGRLQPALGERRGRPQSGVLVQARSERTRWSRRRCRRECEQLRLGARGLAAQELAAAGAGVREAWSRRVSGTRATQEQEHRAMACAGASSTGSEAMRAGTKRWLATRRALEELWWKASARDVGTRWPYRGHS